jgi:hypothetical protein
LSALRGFFTVSVVTALPLANIDPGFRHRVTLEHPCACGSTAATIVDHVLPRWRAGGGKGSRGGAGKGAVAACRTGNRRKGDLG